MTVRHLCVLLHRFIGLAMAGFLAITGLTGSILAFRAELDEGLNPRLFHIEQAGHFMLSPSQLAAKVEAADPNVQIFTITPAYAAGKSATVYVGPALGAPPPGYNEIFLDPATGDILGRLRTPGIKGAMDWTGAPG